MSAGCLEMCFWSWKVNRLLFFFFSVPSVPSIETSGGTNESMLYDEIQVTAS